MGDYVLQCTEKHDAAARTCQQDGVDCVGKRDL